MWTSGASYQIGLPVLALCLFLHCNLVSSYGLRDFEEDCDPDEGKYYNYADESKKCKSELGLHCNENTRRCRCHPNSGAMYNWEYHRCELPVETFCATSGVEWKNICVDNSDCYCNTHFYDKRRWTLCQNQNGYCKCRLGYTSYRDNSGCYYSAGGLKNESVFAIISMLFLSLGTVAWNNY